MRSLGVRIFSNISAISKSVKVHNKMIECMHLFLIKVTTVYIVHTYELHMYYVHVWFMPLGEGLEIPHH